MRETIESTIREDASGDAAFRAALLSDPAAALTERYGMDVPGGLHVRVVEGAANEVVLVLPVDRSELAFSESDLDAATGAAIYVPDKKTYADCM